MRLIRSGRHTRFSMVRWWRDPAQFFLVLGLFSGLVLVFLIPPHQVADEWRHFYRVWQLSHGTIFGHGLGDDVPVELDRLTSEVDAFYGISTRGPMPWRDALQFLRRMAAVRMDEADLVYASFPTVLYAPAPYLGMTAAMALGRLFPVSPLVLLYVGRLGGLALALVLTCWAIRRAPFGKWAFSLMAMTPVVAFQRAGVSADSFINAAAMLHVALVMDLACAPGRRVGPADLFRLGIVTVALCLCKQAYLLLPLLHIVIPASRFSSAGARRIARYWLPALGWLSAVWWAATVMRGNYEPMREGCDAMGQLQWIIAHPLDYPVILFRDMTDNCDVYLHQLIGTLGWLDLPAPGWLVMGQAVVLVLAAILDGGRRGRLIPFVRSWSAFILAASLSLVWTLMYLWWAPVGAPELEGMQGRYFAPFLPLLVLILARPRPGPEPLFPPPAGVTPAAGPWPWAAGGIGIFLTLETVWRTALYHYKW